MTQFTLFVNQIWFIGSIRLIDKKNLVVLVITRYFIGFKRVVLSLNILGSIIESYNG